MNSSADPDWTLLADIGGTNVRFALGAGNGNFSDLESRRVTDFADFEQAAEAYLDGRDSRPLDGAFAVAGPVRAGQAELTNHPWRISAAGAARALGLKAAILVNDFAAIAMAVPHLGPDDVERLGGGEREPRAPIVVLGPGSGLGVSFLIPTGDRWVPVAGEGGHAGIAPIDENDDDLVSRLRDKYGRASLERALSGPGLLNLYQAAAGPEPSLGATPTPAQVAQAAGAGDQGAGAAAKTFSSMLGAAAGDLALTVGAHGGVYIAGGVVPKLGAAFDRVGFRAAFEDKGRFSADVGRVPTFLIVHPAPGILGLARKAAEPPLRS